MADATVVLGRDGMGDGASEADFDAWVGYVAERIDERTGLDVAIETTQRRGVQETRVIPHTDAGLHRRDDIRSELGPLWEEFCADSAAWPARADLAAVDAAGESSAHAITTDHADEWCDPDPWSYEPDPAAELGDECRDPMGSLLDEVRARFAAAFAAVITAHNAHNTEPESAEVAS